MKKMMCFIAGLVLLLGVCSTVQADLVNFGVDVKNDGSYSQVAGGFTGDDTGRWIDSQGEYVLFTIITTFSAGSTITGAELFIDATDVGEGDHDWQFRVYGDQDPGTWIDLGTLQTTSHANTYVPVLLGPFGTKVHTTFDNDIDNTFFPIPSSLFNTILTSDLEVEIQVLSRYDDARIDGANLQVDYTTNGAPVPEPATMLLLGSGLVGLAGFARRRFKK